MTILTGIAGLVLFSLGFFLGREAGKAPGVSACPRCGKKRYHYCGSCGVHFDEKDEAVAPSTHPRIESSPNERD